MRKMFSEKQIKQMIQNSPEEISKALENKDLSVNTLRQKSFSYIEDLDFYNPTDLTINRLFTKAVLSDRTLSLVISLEIKNETANAVSFDAIYGKTITPPDEIKELIYDIDGKTLKEDPLTANTNIQIRTDFAVCNNHNGSQRVAGFTLAQRYNKALSCEIQFPSSISIPANSSKYVSGYIAIIC